MATQYVTCPNCHSQNPALNARCVNCGAAMPNFTSPMQQYPQAQQNIPGAEKKLAAGLCGILLGGLGIHKFILGYNTEGIIMLVVSIAGWFLCGIPSIVVAIIGIIEGIMYLTKSDQEFVQTYIVNKKPWF
jgi:TM2 domain-containing membrane protein YozV